METITWEEGLTVKDCPIIKAQDFNVLDVLGSVKIARPAKGRKYPFDKKTGEKIKYLNIVTAFDIETSTIRVGDNPYDVQAVMYIWQWQLGEICTVIGRTWDDFLMVFHQINGLAMSQDARIMCYVHNLAYEFQFLSGIWDFDPDDVFATDVRDPLYVKMGSIELRCSLRLSNYKLDTWAKNLMTDHQKLVGNLDYSIIRYPWSDLTSEELAYCINDVICVVECVYKMLDLYEDTLYSIPYTSTGYIRRRIRIAMRMWAPFGIEQLQNPLYVYDRLRNAFRGGDTHANRYYVGSLLSDVSSFDRSSSYPDVMCHCKFPMTRFKELEPSWETLRSAIENGKACLAKLAFLNIHLKRNEIGNPYIPYAKCAEYGYCRPVHAKCDNGRILSADYLEITITDIDLEIIDSQYEWESVSVQWCMSARYGYLPQPLIDTIIHLYKQKTSLKGVVGKELQYQHSKEEINSCYGMMCQRVISQPIEYNHGVWIVKPFDRETEYNEAIKHTMLSYAWAVWVTAWARYRLWEGVEISIKNDPVGFVYCDTDSVKCRSHPDFSAYNRKRKAAAISSGAHASDPKGVEHYMGVFEFEGTYDLFKTLGAKRYCAVERGDLRITVAGVPKDNGSQIIKDAGGIESFDFDFLFVGSGKTGSVYNDEPDMTLDVDGHQLRITRNVAIIPIDYRMSVNPDYRELIDQLESVLDEMQNTDYNKKW